MDAAWRDGQRDLSARQGRLLLLLWQPSPNSPDALREARLLSAQSAGSTPPELGKGEMCGAPSSASGALFQKAIRQFLVKESTLSISHRNRRFDAANDIDSDFLKALI
jgi:hypothetical protein